MTRQATRMILMAMKPMLYGDTANEENADKKKEDDMKEDENKGDEEDVDEIDSKCFKEQM
jgi:hypothetical protein